MSELPPTVSVVMPVFNGERYIREAIDSVQTQSFEDIELIIVNDGSTDGTVDAVHEYIGQDPRIKLINRPNSGRPSSSKNEGIASARGRYLTFIDHDDLYDRDRIRLLVQGLNEHTDWIAAFHDMRLVEENGDVLPGSYLSDAKFRERAEQYLRPLADRWYECSESFYLFQTLAYAALSTLTVMIARERIPQELLSFDTRFVICEDTDLWIRLGLHGKIGYLDRVLSSYRQHPDSITKNEERLLLDSTNLHLYNYDRLQHRLPPAVARSYRQKIARYFSELAYVRYRKYDLAGARSAYLNALKLAFDAKSTIGLMKSSLPKPILRRLRERLGAPV